MLRGTDVISNKILKILAQAQQPLETKEIEDSLKTVTRIKILYRLNWLRGDGIIVGKPVGSGKGTWIWWFNSSNNNNNLNHKNIFNSKS